jgi:transcriptional regulator with XRE-family HTH domain
MALLGAKLRELRGDLSLYEVSKATGIASADLSRYEKEDYHPSPGNLKKLADYYEVPYEDLRLLHYEDVFSDSEELGIVLKWANQKEYQSEELILIDTLRQVPLEKRAQLLAQFMKLIRAEIRSL